MYIGLSLLVASSIMACGPTTPTTPATKPDTQPPSQVENQTPPEASQPESPPEETTNEAEWNTVQTFTGKESKTTPPFHISGTEWRIIWTASAQQPEYAVFEIIAYPQDKPGTIAKRISYSNGTPGDTVYIYEGGRDYYLKIIAANLSNWTITVEGYANQSLTHPVQITYINYKGMDYFRSTGAGHEILEFDEYVEIKNFSDSPQNITGWVLKNITKGGPAFTFPIFQPCSCEWYGNPADCIENCYPPRPCVIEPHKSIRVYTGEPHYESGGFCFDYSPGDIWNNETPDTAVLYNLEGQEVSRKSYIIPIKSNVTSDK
ncbi:MAG: lamin tail domain-containing protein [Dehalococcoidia bacterium]|nr:lamin tail domain-containing protein [Dehalococcoidia bacterium]